MSERIAVLRRALDPDGIVLGAGGGTDPGGAVPRTARQCRAFREPRRRALLRRARAARGFLRGRAAQRWTDCRPCFARKRVSKTWVREEGGVVRFSQ